MNAFENEVHDTLGAITRAWRENDPARMAEHIHPDVVMVPPGFGQAVVGRAALIDGFREFCTNASVLEYSESDERIEVAGSVAVASFRFAMIYERGTYQGHSIGRDLWVFQRTDDSWVAVWRTMVDLNEERRPRTEGGTKQRGGEELQGSTREHNS